MRQVVVERLSLLEKVRKNRAKHEQEYNEARDDYKALVIKICQDNIAALTDIGVSDKKIKNIPERPVHYLNEYDRSIQMLVMSVEENITLSSQEFDQLVMDNWAWKNSFLATNSSYKAS